MPTPETTSPAGLQNYLGGKCLFTSKGKAWSDIRATIFTVPPKGMVRTPSVSEPVLLWTLSGEVEIEEREDNKPWIKSRIQKGSFFLTSAGAPYDCRWKALSSEPIKYMIVVVELPLLLRALEEVLGPDAMQARIRDVSGFNDGTLEPLMEQLRDELMRRSASSLVVEGIARLVAVHLARNYAVPAGKQHNASPSLPGYKLGRITDWLAEHFMEEVRLDQLADRAGLSKFHFHRLFKKATGFSPLRYHMKLRMDAARLLLRETDHSIMEIALEVGYTNPSHFAQLFRRDTGLAPSDYRRQR